MTTLESRSRKTARRKVRARRNNPFFDRLEERHLLSGNGFVQGFVHDSSNVPIGGATVQLRDASNTILQSTTTSSMAGMVGYYAFANVAPGTYHLTEVASGYDTSVGASDIQTTINPASAIAANTAIQVTVLDPSQQSLGVTWPGGFAGALVNQQLNASPFNQAGAPDNSGSGDEGQLQVSFVSPPGTLNQGNVNTIYTFCSDLLQGVFANSPFTVQPSLTPNSTTLSTLPSYATNLGEIGYLYNTYGTKLQPPGVVGHQVFTSTDGAALQLALWALEYNQMPASGPMTLQSPDSPFQVNMSPSDPVVMAANAFLAAAFGKSENAYFLNLNTSAELAYGANNGQSMFSTDLLNFTNTPKATPAIGTQQQPATAVVGTSVADKATVTGGFSPTGTVTFNLYNNPNGTGTALFSDTETLSGGAATSAGYTATATGTDYWVATYNGDSNNSPVTGGTALEPVIVSAASPAINTTQQPASAIVGTSVADKATVTGGFSPTGTVTFNLYNNPNGTGTALFSDTEALSGGAATSAGYTATATGTDYWVATYNGDSNNSPVTGGTALEPVIVSAASPAINTTQQPATATVGTSIADKATVSGGYNPTGTVTFNLYSNSTGSGTPLFTDTETLSGGTATSAGYTATATGTDYWVATYNGDSNNTGVTSGVADEPVIVSPATPAIGTQQQPASAVVGSSIADKATVTGGFSPTGSVTFSLYNNSTGAGTPLFTDTETLSGGVATSAPYTATATGTDYWVATYGGDSNNKPVTSGTALEPVTVTQATPAIGTVQQPATATVGGTIADLETVSGGYSPTGTVTFNLYNNPNGTGTPLFTDTETLSGGTATSAGFTATATGTDYWVATYNGDSNNSPVTSGTALEPVTVTPATPSINTSQLPASATVGTAIADKATVSGGYGPTGTVTFKLYNNSTGAGTPLFTDTETLVGGVATSAGYIATAAGTDYWVATYGGDSNNSPVTSGTALEPVIVSAASPAINTTQQPASAVVGTSIADKATVSGGFSPTGTVTFNLYNNSTASGTPLFTDTESLSGGTATSTGYTATATGTDYWVATYNGDGNNSKVTSGTADEPVTVTPASPAINTTQQPASATVGTSIADKATVSGGYNPTGTVTFNLYSNSTASGTPLFSDTETLSGGSATSAGYTATATGTDYWVATYNGDSNNNMATSGTADEPVTITPATPAINTQQQPATAVVGSSIADKATVSGGYNPTGTVTFNLYNNPNGTGTPLFTDIETLSGGVATSAGYTATATGTDYWVATYNGDSNNAAVTSGTALEPVTITPATPTINTSQQPASAVVGSSIADKATVTGGYNPTGTVTFKLYNNSAGTGTPLFTDTESLAGGVATSASYIATSTGTDYWVATYNGDSNNSAVTSGTALEPVVLTPASPSINTQQQPATAVVGSSIADKATVSGGDSPTGTVTFKLYNNNAGTGTPLFTDTETLSGGVATSAGYTATAAGTDYWVATYNGDSNNSAVTSGTALEPVCLTKASPSITTQQQPATAVVGSSIADKATVSGYGPTGTVTFKLYNNSAGTGTPLFTALNVALVNGVATSAGYAATATGTDYWVATYNGDSNNNAVTSGTALEPVTISPATPAINTSQLPATATVGTSIADKATVSGGFSPTGTVTFTLFSNSNGTGLLFTDANEPLSGGVATSTGYIATATGTDYWVATYNGDANNAAITAGTALGTGDRRRGSEPGCYQDGRQPHNYGWIVGGLCGDRHQQRHSDRHRCYAQVILYIGRHWRNDINWMIDTSDYGSAGAGTNPSVFQDYRRGWQPEPGVFLDLQPLARLQLGGLVLL